MIGCTIDKHLRLEDHVRTQVKRANKRMYHLNNLRKLNVDKTIITMFYSSVISSMLTYAIECWFPGTASKTRDAFNKPGKQGSKLLKSDLTTHLEICNTKCQTLSAKIINDVTHPLHK